MIVFIWSCSSILSVSLAWGSFGTCMGSAVTALNHYTKTIIEFKFKRRTIEKKILELDVPEDLWYITSLQEQADQHAALYVNGSEPTCFNPTILDNWDREYCWTFMKDTAPLQHRHLCAFIS